MSPRMKTALKLIMLLAAAAAVLLLVPSPCFMPGA